MSRVFAATLLLESALEAKLTAVEFLPVDILEVIETMLQYPYYACLQQAMPQFGILCSRRLKLEQDRITAARTCCKRNGKLRQAEMSPEQWKQMQQWKQQRAMLDASNAQQKRAVDIAFRLSLWMFHPSLLRTSMHMQSKFPSLLFDLLEVRGDRKECALSLLSTRHLVQVILLDSCGTGVVEPLPDPYLFGLPASLLPVSS